MPKEQSTEMKEMDISWAAFIACHCSILTVEHLTATLHRYGKGTKFADLKLKRTKCSKIILNVLEPALLDQLIAHIGDKPYSIILDESTDVGNMKWMAYCIRYYNEEMGKMVVDFLGIHCVIRATAEVLESSFIQFLESVKLPLKNIVGLGTDGANNLCGMNNSLYTRLKKKIPHLVLVKCICHSLHKCSEYAIRELPSSLNFLVHETRNWFSNSSLRISEYNELHKKMFGTEAPKLKKLSTTRWLVFGEAIQATLDQWECLKKHFKIVSKLKTDEKTYTARILSEMYEDNSNYLYLLFLNPILKDVNNLNICFQASNADILSLYSELKVLLMSYANRIFKHSFLVPRSNTPKCVYSYLFHEDDIDRVMRALEKSNDEFNSSILLLQDVDLGMFFEQKCEEMKLSAEKVEVLRGRCLNFLKTLISELVKRLPNNLAVIYKLNVLSPFVCTSNIAVRPKGDELPWELADSNCNRQEIIQQWLRLGGMTYQEIVRTAGKTEVKDAVEFWTIVANIRNAIDEHIFTDLASFALRALSLPVSNAVVERIFSILNIVKSKIRNRMKLDMLVAILRIRSYFSVRKLCCETFKITKKMIELHNTNMYYRTGYNLSIKEDVLSNKEESLNDKNFDETKESLNEEKEQAWLEELMEELYEVWDTDAIF